MDTFWFWFKVIAAAIVCVILIEFAYLSLKRHNQLRKPLTLHLGYAHGLKAGDPIKLEGRTRLVKSVTETTITL